MVVLRRLLYHPVQWGRRQYSRGIAAVSITKLKFDVLLTNSPIPYSCGKRLRSSSSSYQCKSIRDSCVYNSSVNVDGSSKVIHLQQSQFSCNKLSFSLQLPLHHNQLQKLLGQSRWLSLNRRGRGRVPRMSEMRSLEEALTATYDNLDRLSPRDVSAFWAVVPKFLGGRGPRTSNQQQQTEQKFHQFDLILTKSIQEIDQYGYRELATLAISLAKIIDKMSKRKGHPAEGSSHQVLQDLIGENKQFIFKEIASASVPILYEFNPRHLSNLIYSFGLAEEVVLVTDGSSTFFDMLAEVSIPNLYKSNGQDLSNMLWAYANVKVSNSQLFEQAGDSIVAMDMDNLNEFWPQALSNTLWAYATLNEQHAKLFKKVGDHIVHLPNLESFNGQDLSNTVWAFANTGQSHPQLFNKLADEAIKRQHEFILTTTNS